MEFFNAAANWADHAAVVVSFERDEADGWFAKISFRDSRGPYSALVDMVIPRGKTKDKPAETTDEFQGRVGKLMTAACVKAHKARQGRILA
jgi:hypothetical protein